MIRCWGRSCLIHGFTCVRGIGCMYQYEGGRIEITNVAYVILG